MKAEELQQYADVMAEDCLRYGTQSIEFLKKSIADHLKDAYQKGRREEELSRR